MRSKNGNKKDVLKLIESRMSPQSIRRSNAKARKMPLSLRLAEFRKAMKVDQSAVKGFTQPAISKIEARGDIKLSTLVEYCNGLGAELRILAKRSGRSHKEFELLRA